MVVDFNNIQLLEKQERFMFIPKTQPSGLDVACYVGGFGSGKTFCGSLLGLMLATKYAGIRGLVGAATFPLVRDTTLVEYFLHLDRFGFKYDKHYKYNATEAKLTFRNGRRGFEDGSEILFRHLEEPEKLKSLNLGFIEIEEASQIPETTFDMLKGRCRQTVLKTGYPLKRRRIFMHTNPEMYKGWIFRSFVEAPAHNYRLVKAPTIENIYLPDDYIESLKTYDYEYYRINVLGEFGEYSKGLVTKGFSREQTLRPLEFNPELPLHLSCDFNKDPMCWIIAQKDDKNIYVLDELVLEGTNTQNATLEFGKRFPPVNYPHIIINGDSSGHQQNTKSDYSDYELMIQCLRALGYDRVELDTTAANPRIETRVNSWNSMMCNVSGDRRIFINSAVRTVNYKPEYRCKWLIYNIENLSYKIGTSKIEVFTTDRIKAEPKRKFLGHPFDAITYMVHFYFPIGHDTNQKTLEYDREEFRRLDKRFNLV